MDILTHAVSGMAVASCSATFVRPQPLRRVKILLAGMLGGILPDIDAISMWSRFDATFGQLFNFPQTGKVIYSSKFWYSHHAFFHSLMASLIIGLAFILIIYLSRKAFGKKKLLFSAFCEMHLIYFVTFVIAYWVHLAGDIPTPASAWGGINLFWPSTDYIGGSGKIWWWNNYDIFLLIVCCIITNLSVPLISKYIGSKSQIFTSVMLGLTFILILVQINTRKFDYAYSGYTTKYPEMELNSKKEQERILGKRIYRYMEWFDSRLKFHF